MKDYQQAVEEENSSGSKIGVLRDFSDLECSGCSDNLTTDNVGGDRITPEKACINIYLGIHISQIMKHPPSVLSAWTIGQELYNAKKSQ